MAAVGLAMESAQLVNLRETINANRALSVARGTPYSTPRVAKSANARRLPPKNRTGRSLPVAMSALNASNKHIPKQTAIVVRTLIMRAPQMRLRIAIQNARTALMPAKQESTTMPIAAEPRHHRAPRAKLNAANAHKVPGKLCGAAL